MSPVYLTVPFKETSYRHFAHESGDNMKYLIKNVSHSTTATLLVRVYVHSDNETDRIQVREFSCLAELLDNLPGAGHYLDDEQYEALELAARKTEAIKKGFNILSYGANSPQALKIKLIKRGIDPKVAAFAVEYLTNNGYIRVESDALRMAERCLKKRWGLSRILAYLKSRGFDDRTLYSVEEQYADFDFSLNCEELIRNSYDPLPTELKDKSAMINSLTSYGYTVSEIRRAVNRILSSDRDAQ